MSTTKPSRILRLGMILGAAGCMAIIVIGGLVLASDKSSFSTPLMSLAGLVACVGGVLLVLGGLAYRRRARLVLGKRERELERMGNSGSGGVPAERAELPPGKRRSLARGRMDRSDAAARQGA